ncbi:MAG TPA: ATP-dependent metallopeptidase FtsH/Yme1/Tma family protein, partial [Thermosynechococcus sp. M46_R2017_013]|nr:ATP-dependent metallopeptidase FtsH/Yme1/Tma family protein [Thermosynechococcus sp. M46_R2017_013]
MKVSWKTVLLWSIPLLLVGLLLWQGASNLMLNQSQPPLNTASTRMSYGRFLNYLDAGRISKVDIFDNGRTAIVDVSDPELINGRPLRVRVDMPGTAPEVISKLREQHVEIDVHPARNDGALWSLLGNLLFPRFA